MLFNVYANTMFVGTLRVTANGHHRFRNRMGNVTSTGRIKGYKGLNMKRFV